MTWGTKLRYRLPPVKSLMMTHKSIKIEKHIHVNQYLFPFNVSGGLSRRLFRVLFLCQAPGHAPLPWPRRLGPRPFQFIGTIEPTPHQAPVIDFCMNGEQQKHYSNTRKHHAISVELIDSGR